jgi:hypothetical protein
VRGVYYYYTYRILPTPPREAHTHIENSVHETEKVFGPFRSFQLQAESGGCVVLSGHLAAMMGPRVGLAAWWSVTPPRPRPRREYMRPLAMSRRAVRAVQGGIGLWCA